MHSIAWIGVCVERKALMNIDIFNKDLSACRFILAGALRWGKRKKERKVRGINVIP